MGESFIKQIKPIEESAESGGDNTKPAFENRHAKNNQNENLVKDGDKKMNKIKILFSKLKLRGRDKQKIAAKKMSPRKKKFVMILGGVGIVVTLLLVAITLLSYRVYRKGVILQSSISSLTSSLNEQDLNEASDDFEKVKRDLADFSNSYGTISWLRITPYFGKFINDGSHGLIAAKHGVNALEIILNVIEPYADIVGFSSEKPVSGDQQTTQDRLDFIIQTIPDLIPVADDLIIEIEAIEKQIGYIDPNDYPEEINGKEVRNNIKHLRDLVTLFSEAIRNGKPLLEIAPYLLGVEEERTYLILFQNDKELRPTGGFITGYSIASVNAGKFEPVISSDIYNLDAQYTPTITAPEPLIKYLRGPYALSKKYRLRDINWSPDFYESMKVFSEEAETAGLEDYDGIIAVDTKVIENILEVLGPIQVPGFGEFSTKIVEECNCPQVIFELESFADVEGPIVWSENEPGKIVFAPPNYDNRKKIIGPLMNSVLSNALGQSNEKLSGLFEAGLRSLMEKHVLVYMFDDNAQKAVEDFGIAGRIESFEGDYLHINDANLGGRKSNLYVTQEVAQEIEILGGGSIIKTLKITYRNPEPHDGWLNSILPNWVRIYVPKGSELITFEGAEDIQSPYEELGKTVFAGFFELRPQGISTITLKYKIPNKFDGSYKIFVQKQPGKDGPLYTFKVNGREEEQFLWKDKVFTFDI